MDSYVHPSDNMRLQRWVKDIFVLVLQLSGLRGKGRVVTDHFNDWIQLGTKFGFPRSTFRRQREKHHHFENQPVSASRVLADAHCLRGEKEEATCSTVGLFVVCLWCWRAWRKSQDNSHVRVRQFWTALLTKAHGGDHFEINVALDDTLPLDMLQYGGRIGQGGACAYGCFNLVVDSETGQIDIRSLYDAASGGQPCARSLSLLLDRLEDNFDGRHAIHILYVLNTASLLHGCMRITGQVLWGLAKKLEDEYVSRLSTDSSVKDAQRGRYHRIEESVRDMQALKFLLMVRSRLMLFHLYNSRIDSA